MESYPFLQNNNYLIYLTMQEKTMPVKMEDLATNIKQDKLLLEMASLSIGDDI